MYGGLMKQILTTVAVVTCMIGVPGPSDADPVHGSVSPQASSYVDAGILKGPRLPAFDGAAVSDVVADIGIASFETCIWHLSRCMPESRIDTMLLLTDQTTLIGHLTLDQYASLAEVATVTEMYLTAGTLTVRFLGGAWPGSALSIFETSFPL
jgi:hypothetical protein